VELLPIHADQPAEDEASRRTRDEDVAVERTGIIAGLERAAPDMVAGAIVADPAGDAQREHFLADPLRTKGLWPRGRVRAIGGEQRGDLVLRLVGHADELGRRHAERIGNAVEPVDRQRPRARFEPPDRLRGGRRIAAPGDVVERQPFGAPDRPDRIDHCALPYV